MDDSDGMNMLDDLGAAEFNSLTATLHTPIRAAPFSIASRPSSTAPGDGPWTRTNSPWSRTDTPYHGDRSLSSQSLAYSSRIQELEMRCQKLGKENLVLRAENETVKYVIHPFSISLLAILNTTWKQECIQFARQCRTCAAEHRRSSGFFLLATVGGPSPDYHPQWSYCRSSSLP